MLKQGITMKRGNILPKGLGVILLLCIGSLFDSGLAYFSKEGGSLLLVQVDWMESLKRNWVSYGLYLAGVGWLAVEVILAVGNRWHARNGAHE